MAVPESRARHLKLVEEMPRLEAARFGAVDYLQLATATRRTVRVQLASGAEVDVYRGETWAARDRRGTGEEALMRILLEGGLDGSAEARCLDLQEADLGERNLHIALEAMILEAARQLDEGMPIIEEPDDPDPADEDGTMSLDDIFEAADRGTEAILNRDYGAAYIYFRQAFLAGDVRDLVVANLSRLEEMGYGEPEAE